MESDSRVDVAQENTPLLGSTRTTEHGEDAGNETGTSQTTAQANHKLLFIGSATSLGLAIIGLAFMIASAVMAIYGARHFRFYEDWRLESLQQMLAFASFIAIPFAVTNVVLLKRRGRQVPTLLNILYFGITGFICVGAAMAFCDRVFASPYYCPRDLDDSNPSHGKGTYQACLLWASKYQAVTLIFLAMMACYGVVQCALLVLVIIGLFRNRSNTGTYARWYIPEGQLAFEVSIRWGAPRGQRQNPTEAVGGNPETE
ncbi:Fc.00g093680.m01.CDS01 [Cosmosporella sp. VM-42]